MRLIFAFCCCLIFMQSTYADQIYYCGYGKENYKIEDANLALSISSINQIFFKGKAEKGFKINKFNNGYKVELLNDPHNDELMFVFSECIENKAFMEMSSSQTLPGFELCTCNYFF